MRLAILIAEGDPLIRSTMRDALESAGHVVEVVSDGQEAFSRTAESVYDVVIGDVCMSRVSGTALFAHVKKNHPSTSVILTTAHERVHEAVESLKSGVDDYLTKPFDAGELIVRVARVGEGMLLQKELRDANVTLAAGGIGAKLIGKSRVMQSLIERIGTVAPTDAGVIIFGESGTGKEVVASAIRSASGRANGPFVAVNCSAFPESLIEAELFGHERGAFTGATQRREGCFKAADGGTLLLDEVGEIPLSVQAKLLRVLQERVIQPLGSDQPIPLDVRLICATHRNLKQMIAAGTFREDLYYRLNVLDIHVPPLRSRRSDLPLLVSHFFRKFAGDGAELKMDPAAWAALIRHSFPGNVRELEHAIHHAVVLSRAGTIKLAHLPEDISGRVPAFDEDDSGPRPLAESMRRFERHCLIQALNATDGVKFKAARLLGISRKTLWEKLKFYHITSSDLDDEDEFEPSRFTPVPSSRIVSKSSRRNSCAGTTST
jgi:DNA-binding NtrC family response regulator